jgi:hydroxymethylpyrimidine/phosphomethylpyrimidine kinase
MTFGVADPVGASGVQGDLATFSAHRCHGASVLTGLLIGDTARVEDIQEVEPEWVVDQARVVLEDMPVAAFKVGAIVSVDQVSAIAEIVSDYPDVPLILDPFLSNLPDAGMGDEDILMAIRHILVPQATVLLLSQVELARLAETWRDPTLEDVLALDVAELTDSGCEYVLVTGTAQPDATRANTLFNAEGVVGTFAWSHMQGPFVGAGSTLSSAITALMAQQMDGETAIKTAHDYTTGTLVNAQRFGMGKMVPNRFFPLFPTA